MINRTPDHELCDARGGGIDWRERFRDRISSSYDAITRMHHLCPEEAGTHLTKQAQTFADSKLLDLTTVKIQKAQI